MADRASKSVTVDDVQDKITILTIAMERNSSLVNQLIDQLKINNLHLEQMTDVEFQDHNVEK